jgi:predicted aspartyl protease
VLCGLALVVSSAPALAANILPIQGATNLATPTGAGSLAVSTLVGSVVTPGTTGYTSTGATATVTLTAPRTLIDWTTFEVGAGNTLNFNFTGSKTDIVLNRLGQGAINVDAGGTVNGLFNGKTGGNIWFLAPNGVFLNGTVTAGGVLATNNAALADLNLLSDNINVLKAELAAGGGLLDLQGAVTATGAQVDGAGNIILTGDVDTGPAGVVALDAAGIIDQTGGVITAASVSGTSSAGASLTDANLFDKLTGFTNTGMGNVYIVDAQPTGLTITGPVNGGSGNDLQISAIAGPLTVNASLTAASNAAYGGEVDLEAGAGLTLAANVSTAGTGFAEPGLVTLTASSGVSQTGGVISSSQLSANTEAGDIILNQPNQIDSLEAGFAAGNFSLTDASAGGLTVTGDGVGASNVSLTTTTLGGGLSLFAAVSAPGGVITLTSAGPISQTAPITAATLTGSSVGGAALSYQSNSFDNLGAFTNTGVGDVVISDTNFDGAGLTVTGAVDAGFGNALTLNNFAFDGPSGPLTLAADVTAAGGTVNLNSATAIIQTAGAITAATLNSASNGSNQLIGPNQVVTLGQFTNNGAGDMSYTDATAAGVTFGSDINSGAGNITLSSVTPGTSLTLSTNLSTQAGFAVTVNSAGPVSQTAGVISTSTLSGSSVGGATLNDANLFDSLAGFTNTGAVGISITDAQPTGLTVTADVDAGAGNVLTLNNAAGLCDGGCPGPLTLSANLTAAGGAVDLISTGSILQTAGVITAASVSGTSSGGASLTDPNLFDNLTGFTNTGMGNVYIVDAQPTGLTITGPVDGGSGNDLQISAIAGPLTVNASLTAASNAAVGGEIDLEAGAGLTLAADVSTAGPALAQPGLVTLTAGGGISQTGGIITSAQLSASSEAGDVVLTGANQIVGLNFGSAGGSFSLTDASAGGLTVSPNGVGASNITLTTTTLGGGLSLLGPLSAPGGVITLTSAGPIGQAAPITAATLTGSSVGGATLSDEGNSFDNLGPFTNTGLGDVVISDANFDGGGLTVTGALDAGAGNALTLNNLAFDGPTGPLTLTADVMAAGGAVNLNSATAIVQTAGVITTATLNSASNGSNQLTGSNQVALLGTFTNGGAGDMSFTDAIASGIVLSGDIDAGAGNLTLSSLNPGTSLLLTNNLSTQSGFTVTLNSAGPVSQTAGVISTGALSGNSVGGATLNNANLFDTLAGFTNTGAVGISITDTQPTGLTVTADVDAGAGNVLTLNNAAGLCDGGCPGPLTLSANLTAAGGTVDLISAGAITQTSGVITTSNLTGSAVGGVSLTDANLFDNVAGFADTNAAGGDCQPFCQPNPSNLAITDAQPTGMTITADVVADLGDTVTLTTTFGPLALQANVVAPAGTVALASAGAISQGAGLISAGSLSSVSVGDNLLTGPNQVATLTTFANGGVGNMSYTDATESGVMFGSDINAGAGNLTLSSINPGTTLTLTTSLTAAQTVTLNSAGPISQSAGAITALALSGSSVGGATIADPVNAFAMINGFSNGGVGDVTTTDGLGALAVVGGGIDVGTGNNLFLTNAATNGPAGDLTLAANLNAPGGSINLSSAGTITQTLGAITAATLNSASNGSNQLAGPNQVVTLGQFTNNGAGDMSYTNATVTGVTFGSDIDSGAGNLTLSSVNPGTTLTLTTNLSAQPGFTVTLNSAGPVAQTSGVITAGGLAGSSVGGATLLQANLFDTLGGFANTGGVGIQITDARPTGLTVTGAVDAGPGNDLQLNATTGPLTINADLTAEAGGQIELSSAGLLTLAANLSAPAGATPGLVSLNATGGGILQTAGVITTSQLAANASNDVALNQANVFDTLVAGAAGGTFSLTDASPGGLTVTGDGITANNINLTTTNGGLIDIAAGVGAYDALNLASSGTIVEDPNYGRIYAYALSGASVGGASFNGENQITNLGPFTNTGGGGFSLTDNIYGGLTVTGDVDAGAGNVLTLNNGAGPCEGVCPESLTLAANLTASGGTVDLISVGTIVQTGGVITSGGLSGTSVGGASLTGANQIGALTSFTNSDSGAITLVDSQSLAVTGLVDNTQVANVAGPGRDVSLSVTGDLTGNGVFQAARDVAIQASGDLATGQISAGGNVVLRSGGGVAVTGDLISGLTPSTNGDTGGAGAALAASAPMTLFGAADPALTGGDVDIRAATVAIAGSVYAGFDEGPGPAANDVRITTTGGDARVAGVTTSSLQVTGDVFATRDVALQATAGGDGGAAGSILVGGQAFAARDVAIGAQFGDLTLGSATAYDDVVLAAPGGAITLNGSVIAGNADQTATSGIGQSLFNLVHTGLDGLFSLGTQSIFVAGASYANSGYLNETPAVIQAPGAIGISLADPNGLVLANADPAGSWIYAPSLLAPTVSIFEAGGDLTVGAATIDASVANLNLYANQRVLVTGAFAPSSDSTVALTIGNAAVAGWTPALIEVINDSGPPGTTNTGDVGSIGVATLGPTGAYTNARTFQSVTLYATSDILLGTQAFVSANAAITDPLAQQSINPNTPIPAVGADISNAVLLAAGDVSLSGGALIVQQNTNGLQTNNGVGAYITRSLTLAGYAAADPPRAVDLFGAFLSGDTAAGGGLITGPAAAASTQISLSANLTSSPYRMLYRFNGCVIGSTTLCSAAPPVPPPTLSTIGVVLDPTGQEDPPFTGSFESYPQGFGGPLDPDDPRNLGLPGSGRGGTARIVTGPMFDLWVDGLLAQDAQDIEDPTITGAPNEEIWRKPEDHP